MPHEHSPIDEIDRKYQAGDKFFSQGVELGMKSFDHFITISSAALGLLLTLKSGLLGGRLELNNVTGAIFVTAVLGFVIAIITSIYRNYFAGYALIHRAERFISKSNAMRGKEKDENMFNHFSAKDKEKTAELRRKVASFIARNSFIIAILMLGMLVAAVQKI